MPPAGSHPLLHSHAASGEYRVNYLQRAIMQNNGNDKRRQKKIKTPRTRIKRGKSEILADIPTQRLPLRRKQNRRTFSTKQQVIRCRNGRQFRIKTRTAHELRKPEQMEHINIQWILSTPTQTDTGAAQRTLLLHKHTQWTLPLLLRKKSKPYDTINRRPAQRSPRLNTMTAATCRSNRKRPPRTHTHALNSRTHNLHTSRVRQMVCRKKA